MAPQETGKQRAARIPLDYYKKPDALQRTKGWLTAVAFVAAAIWLTAGLAWTSRGQSLYSRGPVAAVHAIWEDNCNACHSPFQPVSGENLLLNQRLIADRHLRDQKCQTCHAGPEHHAIQQPHDVRTCASCHREHGGRDASLVRMDDSVCTRCHEYLYNHVQGYPPILYENVSGFDPAHHPEFKLLRSGSPLDPGKLKFNHKLHLTPGQVLEPGGKAWTLADIHDPRERERFRQPEQKGNEAPVKLECSSCHWTDSREFSISNGPPRTSGAYMLPIAYDIHCKACHPLTFDPKRPELAVPHRLQPDRLNEFLKNTYTAEYLSNNPMLLDRPIPARRPLPGKTSAVEGPEEEKARRYIQDRIVTAERILYAGKTTCGECHYYDRMGGVIPKRVVPTDVPEIWFLHAQFDHHAHRALRCQACHEGAEASTKHTDVLIPGVENCIRCHGPARGSGDTLHGGARFDCNECHRYHHGDGAGALQGPGAKAREPEDKFRRAEDFLSGILQRSREK